MKIPKTPHQGPAPGPDCHSLIVRRMKKLPHQTLCVADLRLAFESMEIMKDGDFYSFRLFFRAPL